MFESSYPKVFGKMVEFMPEVADRSTVKIVVNEKPFDIASLEKTCTFQIIKIRGVKSR